MILNVQDAISDQEFNDQLDWVTEMVLGELRTQKKKSFYSELTMLCRKNPGEAFTPNLAVFFDLPPTFKERARAMTGLGAKAADDISYKDGKFQGAIVSIFFASEVWIKMFKGKEPKNPKLPSEYPDRREAIVIIGRTIDGRTNMATVHLSRDKKDNIMPKLERTDYYGKSELEQQQPILEAWWEGYALAFVNHKK